MNWAEFEVTRRRTKTEQQTLFGIELAAAVAGEPLRVHGGLGAETEAALIAISFAYPEVPGELIDAARRAFAVDCVRSAAAEPHVEPPQESAEAAPVAVEALPWG